MSKKKQQPMEVSDGKKRKSIDVQMEMTDGKNRSQKTREEQEKEILYLEEILGTGKSNPYGTTNFEVFENKLVGMTLDELRLLASRVGLTPVAKESVLRKSLKESFDDFIRKSRQNISGPSNGPSMDHPAIKNIKHLL